MISKRRSRADFYMPSSRDGIAIEETIFLFVILSSNMMFPISIGEFGSCLAVFDGIKALLLFA